MNIFISNNLIIKNKLY